jgi:capsular exopolysaccharide synthesis family protein
MDAFSQLQTNQALARTYAELLKSPQTYRETVAKEHLTLRSEDLMNSTTVSYVEGTDLIRVEVRAQDPRQATFRANALAHTFVDEQKDAGDERLTVAEPAFIPNEPESPSWTFNMSMALLLGIASALGGIMLLDFLSDRVSSQPELEKLVQAPVLGSLPRAELGNGTASKVELGSKRTGRLKDKERWHSPGAAYEEAMQTLRVNLAFALGTHHGTGVILVTSAAPQEGKTTVSGYLALSYARAECNCLLVDADLRGPGIHRLFNLRNVYGLSDVLLEGPDMLRDCVLEVEGVPRLQVLTSGFQPPNPVDLLSRANTEDVVRKLREDFDTVILDSPPAQSLADASILGSLADGILLVVDVQRVQRRSLSRVVKQLRDKGRILGVVLNGVPPASEEQGYY